MTGGTPAGGWADVWLMFPPGTVRPCDPPPDRWATGELSEEERRRAAAFLRPADRALYLAAHITLRRVLAGYLAVPPEAVTYVREPCPGCGEPHGRPAVEGGAVHFSLSHSGGVLALGVASEPIGVDVENVSSQETVALCAPSLHPVEQKELSALPRVARPRAFTRLWTRKEAYLKGIGTGLARGLATDYLGAGGPDAPAGPAGWSVRNIPCGARARCVAAAAVTGVPARVPDVRRLPAALLHTDDVPAAVRAARPVAAGPRTGGAVPHARPYR